MIERKLTIEYLKGEIAYLGFQKVQLPDVTFIDIKNGLYN